MTIGDRIKAERLRLGYTLEDVARYTKVSRQTIQKYESGVISNIPSDKIEAIATCLHVSPGYLMGWEEAEKDIYSFDNVFPIHKKRFPLLGEIACGKPIYADEDLESYVEAGANIRADFCLRAKGDSMINARIHDGDIVFIRKQEMVEDGEIAAVIINDEATLKRVYYNQKANILQLVAENPAFPPFVYSGEELNQIHILGKAIAFQSDVK